MNCIVVQYWFMLFYTIFTPVLTFHCSVFIYVSSPQNKLREILLSNVLIYLSFNLHYLTHICPCRSPVIRDCI